MATSEAVSENPTARAFKPYADTVREHLRYELVRRNLAEAATGGALNVLAVGPESAIDSLSLAKQGHNITIVDAAKEQQGEVVDRLGTNSFPFDMSVDIRDQAVQDVCNTPNIGRPYDLLLWHDMEAYRPPHERRNLLKAAVRLVRLGGQVSLLERGYYGAMAELSRRGRHDEVKTLRNEDRIVNEHGAQVWPFRPGWLTHTARRLDVATYRVFGVVTTASMFDTRPLEKVHMADLAALADAEYIDGARRDTLGVAGWLQLTGRFGGAVVPTPR